MHVARTARSVSRPGHPQAGARSDETPTPDVHPRGVARWLRSNRLQIVAFTIFILLVWQIVNAAIYRTYPTVPIVVGGLLIVTGGLIVTFWNQSAGGR